MERLDKYFGKLANPCFARYGFATAEILARWPEIAGEALSRYCQPERIRWPRGLGEQQQRTGGTLILRVAAGRSLELQHSTHNIMERVNRFYGFGAISSIKLVTMQGFVARGHKPEAPGPSPETMRRLDQELQTVSNETLRAALYRLGLGALSRGRSSPQGK